MRIANVSLLLLVFAASNSAATEPDHSKHYIVVRTETVKRLPVEETGNLSPSLERQAGPDEIWSSNSCGFAEYSYAAVKLEEYSGYFNTAYSVEDLPTIHARGHLGEWCRLEPFLYEKPTLVTIGYWNGTAHVTRGTAIHWDGDDREYIDNPAVIEENGWTDKVVEIPDPTNSSNCFTKDGLSNDRFEFLAGRPNVDRFGEKYCFSKGVYIRDLSENWKETDFIKTLE